MYFQSHFYSTSPIQLPVNQVSSVKTPTKIQTSHKYQENSQRLSLIKDHTSEIRGNSHRKSLNYKVFLEESIEKRNLSYAKLEKTIQTALDQSKKTKELIKEFITPYKNRKNNVKEKENHENTASFHQEEPYYSFNTPNKENQEFLGFIDKLEDYHEDDVEEMEKYTKVIKEKFHVFEAKDYVKNIEPRKTDKNIEKDIIYEKFCYIEEKTGLDLRKFFEELYVKLKEIEEKNEIKECLVFKERTNNIKSVVKIEKIDENFIKIDESATKENLLKIDDVLMKKEKVIKSEEKMTKLNIKKNEQNLLKKNNSLKINNLTEQENLIKTEEFNINQKINFNDLNSSTKQENFNEKKSSFNENSLDFLKDEDITYEKDKNMVIVENLTKIDKKCEPKTSQPKVSFMDFVKIHQNELNS